VLVGSHLGRGVRDETASAVRFDPGVNRHILAIAESSMRRAIDENIKSLVCSGIAQR
jgi:hypothetical protein